MWTFETDGLIAHAAISADGRLLFVASHDDHVYAVDVESGKQLWKQDLEKNIFGLLASERAVVAVTGADAIYAYQPSNGTVMWSKPVKLSLMMPGFGVMLADEDTVYIATLKDRVIALDWQSGEIRWERESEGNASLRGIADGSLLVAEKKSLKAYDLGSGDILWKFDGNANLHVQPALDLGGAVAFHNGMRGKKAAVFAVDTTNGELLWSRSLQRASVDKKRVIHVPEDYSSLKTTVGVQRDETGKAKTIYVPDSKGINAIAADDGKLLWRTPARNVQFLTLAAGAVFIADARGVIHRLRTTDGKILWSHDTDHSVYQMKAVGDALLATLFSGDLVVLASEDGQLRAEQSLGEPYRLTDYGEDRVIICGRLASWVVTPRSGNGSGATWPGDDAVVVHRK
jgi:outer membrane protein assembly factor BamB